MNPMSATLSTWTGALAPLAEADVASWRSPVGLGVFFAGLGLFFWGLASGGRKSKDGD